MDRQTDISYKAILHNNIKGRPTDTLGSMSDSQTQYAK